MARSPSPCRAFLPYLIACVVPALAAQPGCGDARREDPQRAAVIEVTDDEGRTLRLSEPASRIISLIPARTDVILALGAADRLVARTQFDTDSRLASLPAIDQALLPSVEWLIEQRPDLVIAWPDRQSRTVVTRLAELGIPVYASRVETLGELRECMKDIGALIGREDGADSIIANLEAVIEQVRAETAARPKRSVLYLIGLDPPMAAGPATFIDEMIQIAGGVNVMRGALPMWPQVSAEEIVARQPDVVFLSASDTANSDILHEFVTAPGFRHLEAVEQKRVFLLDANLFDRPGPSLSGALRRLALMIHPELQN